MMKYFIAVALLLSTAFPAAADFMETLGVRPIWDMQRTQLEFARAGISEHDFHDAYEQGEFEKDYAETMARQISDDMREKFFAGKDAPLIPIPECIYYRNGLDAREDIHAVGICFMEQKYQFLITVFFRRGQTDTETLRKTLTEKYGEPIPNNEDTWAEAPALYGKMVTTKYINIYDLSGVDPAAARILGVCTIVNYISAFKYVEYVTDKQAEMEKAAKAAAEQAKQKRRKGL